MINPIILIVAAALLLSSVAVTVLNRPRFPLIAATLIAILVFFVLSSYLIDSAIGSFSASDSSINSIVSFLVIGDDLTNIRLEEAFHTLMYIDIGLFAASLISMFVEAMFILRKNSDV